MIQSEKIDLNNGSLIYFPNFFDENDSNLYFNELSKNIDFNQHKVKIYGKVYLTPRLESFHSLENRFYTYSGNKLPSKPFNLTLYKILEKVEKATNSKFNCVLINLYRNGQDSNGWHADNEKELGPNPVIASLSFGETRRFDLRNEMNKEKFSIDLNSGDLLWMDDRIQNNYKHQIAKTKKVIQPRINLTFRYIY
ncbi:MAG: alpha-ketoglutarate-dependent dioxygenase AlkB [Bacteroidetes bacterium]|nr:alpha-ketoglutarate-dependent dioxygenase AlkB [Bacteroidota bacterium]